jgi:3-oxoadipate enol-lactonase
MIWLRLAWILAIASQAIQFIYFLEVPTKSRRSAPIHRENSFNMQLLTAAPAVHERERHHNSHQDNDLYHYNGSEYRLMVVVPVWHKECEKDISRTYGTRWPRSYGVKASFDWLKLSGGEFGNGIGNSSYAHLSSYTAEFREWGRGRALVLVPGLAGGVELMGSVARALADHFRVICYQLRGEADCFALRRRFDLGDLVDDLAEFLDWHSLESPPIFGVSFGGVLALEFASRYPHRLSALALQGVGASFERGLLQRVASTVLSRYPLPPDNPFVNQFFNLLFGSRQKPGPLFEFVTRQCWQTDQGVMAHRFQMVERFDIRPRLSRIRVPTLALIGERDLLVSERSLSDLVRGIKNVRQVRLEGTGHLAAVSDPGRVAEEVYRFLEPLECSGNKYA